MSDKRDSRINSKNFDVVLENIVADIRSIPLPTTLTNISDDDQKDDRDIDNRTEHKEDVLHKADLMLLNNGWNDKNERIVISIGENAASYKWMHEKSASIYNLVDKVLSIILIIFSTGLSAETIFPESDSNSTLSILRRLFTYIVTLISVLQNFLKYEHRSEQHLSIATSFSQLYHDIQKQMCMYRRDRNNASKYVADTLKQYDSMVVNGPNISPLVVRQFKDVFKNADISIPDIADRIQKIEIISEQIQMAPTPVDINITSKAAENQMDNAQSQHNSNKRYGRHVLCNNLKDIHNMFQIHGDISDKDLQTADAVELRELRNKFLAEKSNFEFQRYLQHSHEAE
jgi:hypothetical protein